MKSILNKTSFKFAAGFVAIVVLSFVAFAATNYYEVTLNDKDSVANPGVGE
ncbi:MAG: hypothetical protein QF704_13275 [Anaerolineales bacterium]|jgi:hypothetical protein|nr:hypothetical protein [Anaerolineales bacterium]|tara:strand:- start:18041 stop:18193 length:153 start_codon:yes stop_codon:yes gene_type:complete